MPRKEPPQPQPNHSLGWKHIVELSPETEELLDQVMVNSNFKTPDEAFQNALRHYLDDQGGLELNPELAASLNRVLKDTEEGVRVSAQEARRRIHEWVVQSSAQRLQ